MKKNKFISLLLTAVIVLSVVAQATVFPAFAEDNKTSLVLGDSNLDFKVNVRDATNIQKAIAKLTSLGDYATKAADVNNDDKVDIKDATAIQKWLANMDVEFLIGEIFSFIAEIIEGGFITLRVNPEIRIGYNPDGNVTSVEAANEDAKNLLADFAGYEGKECKEIVDSLMALIAEAGYLVDDFDGESKVVIIQLEAGCKEPKEGFIEELEHCAKHKAKDFGAKPEFVKIKDKDYDEKYATGDEASPFITLEKAMEIALAYTGVWAEDAVFEEKEYEIHHGTPYYDLEFSANGFEFECKINALNGRVMDFEKEKCDKHPSTSDEVRPDRPEKPATHDEFITLDKAKEIALNHAELKAEDVKFTDRDFNLEDGTPYYDLEFVSTSDEYEYKIHAVTGEIIESECEPIDEDDRHHNDKFDDERFDDDKKPANPMPSEPVETKPVKTEPQEKPEHTEPNFTKPDFTKSEKDEHEDKLSQHTDPAEDTIEPTFPEKTDFIDIEDAKDEAIKHAGTNKDKVKFDKAELDKDDSKHLFEIEFEDDEFEYEYEIDAENGKILDFERAKKTEKN